MISTSFGLIEIFWDGLGMNMKVLYTVFVVLFLLGGGFGGFLIVVFVYILVSLCIFVEQL